MIGLMERACIQAVQPYLTEGHTTVGFKVEAYDEDKKVGDGAARRAIIAIARKDLIGFRPRFAPFRGG
jgi:predicted thioesterase